MLNQKSLNNSLYLDRLDHLRFLASLMVVFWHFIHFPIMNNFMPTSYVPPVFIFSLFEEGFTGVSLFIVLSGFLFQYITTGKLINYKNFIINRFFRVGPLFIFFCLFMICFESLDSIRVVFNSLFLIKAKDAPLVGWTIITEFQFYLLFPILKKILEGKNGTLKIIGIIFLANLIRTIVYLRLGTVQEMAYYSIFGRIYQFLVGMLLGKLYWHKKDIFLTKKVWNYVGISFLIFIVFAFCFHLFNKAGGYYYFYGGDYHYPSKNPIWICMSLMEGIGYASLICFYILLPLKLPKIINKFLSLGGQVSYSTYWWHMPLIWLLCDVITLLFSGHVFSVTIRFIVLIFIYFPFTYFISWLSFKVIESPFIDKKIKYLTSPEILNKKIDDVS